MDGPLQNFNLCFNGKSKLNKLTKNPKGKIFQNKLFLSETNEAFQCKLGWNVMWSGWFFIQWLFLVLIGNARWLSPWGNFSIGDYGKMKKIILER